MLAEVYNNSRLVSHQSAGTNCHHIPGIFVEQYQDPTQTNIRLVLPGSLKASKLKIVGIFFAFFGFRGAAFG